AGELPRLFRALAGVGEYAPFAEALVASPPRPPRGVFDDARVSDHHAIVPTGRTDRIGALDRDERRLFDLVARRFLGAFFPDAEFAVSEVWIRVGDAAGERPLGARSDGAEAGGAGHGSEERDGQGGEERDGRGGAERGRGG